jgi:hypothetical protein
VVARELFHGIQNRHGPACAIREVGILDETYEKINGVMFDGLSGSMSEQSEKDAEHDQGI